MNDTVIQVNNLSKQYRLGKVGRKTLHHDFNRWLYSLLGKEDPYLKIGDENDRTIKGNSEYVWALRDIDFSVNRADVMGIIGKNGAGKSTLLKILSKVTAPTTGEVKIKGRIASLLEVGTGFHPELSGRDNIFLNGAILGMTKKEIKAKFDEIVDFAGVERYIDTPVKRYSSGMYVRLAFAVAAHLEPDILIVDEVLAVGDAEFQKKCLGKMRDVSQNEGRTILFVSHNMGAIKDLCKNAVYLKNGRIELCGEVDDVVSYYFEETAVKVDTLIPVAERTDRGGNGKARITDVKLIDEKTGRQLEHVVSGDNIVFEVSYESKTKESLKNLHVGMPVYTKSDQFLTPLNNKMANYYFDSAPAKARICCRIQNLPLMAGDFYITPLLYVDSELADKVERAFRFTVEPNDYYKSGTSSSYNRQGIYINQEWFLI